MGRKRLALTGQQFGQLTVIAFAGMSADIGRSGQHTYWRCQCTCGREIVVVGYNLVAGCNVSCGAHGRGYTYTPAVPWFTPRQLRGLTRELARVAAHEGEPARENFRRRAWLNPHLAAALPAENAEVAA
jgi:hypothetical protein